jgi:hypothetical protein
MFQAPLALYCNVQSGSKSILSQGGCLLLMYRIGELSYMQQVRPWGSTTRSLEKHLPTTAPSQIPLISDSTIGPLQYLPEYLLLQHTHTSTATPTNTLSVIPSLTPTTTPTIGPAETPTVNPTTPPSVPTNTATPTTPPATPTVPSGSNTGFLRDELGQGIPDVAVYAFKSSPSSSVTKNSTERGVSSTITDQDGRYIFMTLSAGSYRLEPDLTGYAFQPPAIVVDEGGSAPTISMMPVNLNDDGCSRTNVSSVVVSADPKVQALEQFLLSSIERFSAKANTRLRGREARILKDSLNRAEADVDNRY